MLLLSVLPGSLNMSIFMVEGMPEIHAPKQVHTPCVQAWCACLSWVGPQVDLGGRSTAPCPAFLPGMSHASACQHAPKLKNEVQLALHATAPISQEKAASGFPPPPGKEEDPSACQIGVAVPSSHGEAQPQNDRRRRRLNPARGRSPDYH